MNVIQSYLAHSLTMWAEVNEPLVLCLVLLKLAGLVLYIPLSLQNSKVQREWYKLYFDEKGKKAQVSVNEGVSV